MRLKIVCVDDDQSLLHILKTSLGAVLNADVVSYPNPSDALPKLAAEPPPHILVCDYMMPQVDGIAFLGMVNALPGWDKTCIIMLSAVGGSLKQAALRQRVYAVIEKPMKPIILSQTIAELYQKFSTGVPSPLATAIQAKADAEAAKRGVKK